MEDPNNDAAKLLGGSVLANPDKARAASPVTFVSAKTCPFFIAHGDQDNVVPLQQSEELDSTLRKAGASSTLDVVPGAGHAFQNDEPYDRAIAFLKQQLGS